jgi:hypothetical protein
MRINVDVEREKVWFMFWWTAQTFETRGRNYEGKYAMHSTIPPRFWEAG